MEKQEKHFPRRWSAYLFNMIILSLFFYIFIREDYPIRLTKRINLIFTPTATEPKKYSYKHNNKFHEKTDLFTLYGNKKDIIMLGASIIERVDWNELLSRNDIANRGIGSDVTEGYLNRLNSIFHLSPKLCFIQGGGNDLSKGIPQREIIHNLNKLTDTLKSNNMSCILMAVNYVTKEVSEKDSFNLKVHKLNKEIYKISKQKNIDIIDINPIIAPNRNLQKEYSIKDGVHLNSKAYALWKNEIEKIINKKLSASP